MVVARKRATKTVYYATFKWQGKRVWEKSGTEQREAHRLEQRRKQEVAMGTYVPGSESGATTVRQYAGQWLDNRSNRTADDDRSRIETHVLTRAWFADMPIRDVRPKHVLRLVQELKTTVSAATGAPLAVKMVANVYGAVRTMFRAARFDELTSEDPCVLPRGSIARKSKSRRQPYTAAEAQRLTGELVEPDRRIWNALAIYSGMREGEVCGRRFRDIDLSLAPLGCLTVATQYDDQPLKTDDDAGDHPRAVPVHPELAELLVWWWNEGFEFVYCRRPTRDDFIVPRRSGEGNEAHTRSTAYKAWRRSCTEAQVENRSLHSTRHTFITLARRGGARKDVIERITHNASGDIVDAYTTWDWEPLCEAVSCLRVDVPLTPVATAAENKWRRRESKSSRPGSSGGRGRNSSATGSDGRPPGFPRELANSADVAARLRTMAARDDLARLRAAWDHLDAFAAAVGDDEAVDG